MQHSPMEIDNLDVLLHIFVFLTGPELLNASLMCKSWREFYLQHESYFWSSLCVNEFGAAPPEFEPTLASTLTTNATDSASTTATTTTVAAAATTAATTTAATTATVKKTPETMAFIRKLLQSYLQQQRQQQRQQQQQIEASAEYTVLQQLKQRSHNASDWKKLYAKKRSKSHWFPEPITTYKQLNIYSRPERTTNVTTRRFGDVTFRRIPVQLHATTDAFLNTATLITKLSVEDMNRFTASASANLNPNLKSLSVSSEQERETARVLTNDSPYAAVTAINSSVFQIIELETGAVWREFSGHSNGINDVQCVYRPKSVLLDSESERTSHLTGLSFYDSFLRIISASSDMTLKVWNLSNAKCITTLKGHTSPVYGVACDQNLAISCSHNGSLCMWDLDTATRLSNILAHNDVVYNVRYDGFSTAVTCSRDGTVAVWDTRSNDLRRVHTLQNEHVPIYSVDFYGHKLTFGDRNGSLHCYDFRMDRKTPLRIHSFAAENRIINRVRIDEAKIACGFTNHPSVALFDADSFEEMRQISVDELSSHVLAFDSQRLLIADTLGAVNVVEFCGQAAK